MITRSPSLGIFFVLSLLLKAVSAENDIPIKNIFSHKNSKTNNNNRSSKNNKNVTLLLQRREWRDGAFGAADECKMVPPCACQNDAGIIQLTPLAQLLTKSKG